VGSAADRFAKTGPHTARARRREQNAPRRGAPGVAATRARAQS
jgi:hypothetical protein